MSDNEILTDRSDLANEFRSRLTGRVSIADGVFAPLVSVAVNAIWRVAPADVAVEGATWLEHDTIKSGRVLEELTKGAG